jgi:hypothetical protein
MGTIPVQAQVKPDAIERAKRATALVEVVTDKGQATGSAFCIDASGLFVTNAHVIAEAGTGDRIQLVVDIGRRTQRSLRATALWTDDLQDLALLKVQPGGRPLFALTLGKDANLKEGTEVTTFGFPFGPQLALDENTYPEVSVNLSRVTSLRREQERLGTIRFDGQLNPGNSGGPVLGPGGEVVGVAVATVIGGGINFAIPVGRLAEALTRPNLQFLMPPVKREERMRPTTWRFKVIPPWRSAKPPEGLNVVVTLAANVGEPRTFSGRPSGDGTYQVTLSPVPIDPDCKVELKVQMKAVDAGNPAANPAIAEVRDCDVTVGSRRFRLGDLSMICFHPGFNHGPYVFLSQGGAVEGPIRGLGTVTANLRGKTTTIDLTQTYRIDVGHITYKIRAGPIVDVLVELRDGAKTISTCHKLLDFTAGRVIISARTVGGDFVVVRPASPDSRGQKLIVDDDGLVTIGESLDIDGVPRGAGRTIRPPSIPQLAGEAGPGPAGGSPNDVFVRTLSAEVSDIAFGGGGRYLLLVSKKRRQLAIFDVNSADVIKTVALPSHNVYVAAGARKFILAYPDENLIQAWDLEHLKSDGGLRTSPINGRLKGLAMGSDSDGPILAHWESSKPSDAPHRLSFIDVSTLEVLKVGPSSGTHCEVSPSRGTFILRSAPGRIAYEGAPWEVRASPGGNLFGLWDGGSSTEQFVTLSVRGGKLGLYFEGIPTCGFVAPGADGVTVFTGLFGRLDAFGNPISGPPDPSRSPHPWTLNRPWELLAVPSASPAYFLVLGAAPFSKQHESKGTVSASIHAAGDGARLLTMPALQEMTGFPAAKWYSERLTVDKRIHFIPDAKLLITIPPTNDRLVLRRIDIDAAIDRAADPILILSPPLINAIAGQPLQTQVQAKSTKGDVRFTLVEGPKGLSVSPDGRISWPSPEQPHGVGAKVVLSLLDPAGRTRSQEIVVRVQ